MDLTQKQTALCRAARKAGRPCLLFMPVISYLLLEAVTGNLGMISLPLALLNIGWSYALYLLVFGISGTTRIAIPTVSLLLLAISLGEAFVVAFRDRPITLWDVVALRTAVSVSANYRFRIMPVMGLAVLLVLVLNVFLWFVPLRLRGWRQRLAGAGLTAVALTLWIALFFLCIVPAGRLNIRKWNMSADYRTHGYLLATGMSLRDFFQGPPKGYSEQRLAQLYQDISEAGRESADASEAARENAIQPVNLICIMNESLSDLRADGSFPVNQEYFPFLNRLREHTVRGTLCMPVFGSMTSNSEFEFLTGDSMAVVPTDSIAYQFNVHPGALTMVSTLKKQGYRTVAMHPYPAANWNRENCYRNMGFDEFLDERYYSGSELLRHYVSDKSDYDKLIQMVEEKERPEDKLFLFNVTMQNHGGYGEPYDNFQQEIALTGEYEGQYPMADQYLSLMKKSDEALQYLLEYFSSCSEPTMIVLFGDHQPSVETEFYDRISRPVRAQETPEQALKWYETPFLIWTNYPQPEQELGRLGAIYLSSYVLKLANLRLTPYNRFLLDMAREVPVVHWIGALDRMGAYYTWDAIRSGNCPYSKTILDYVMMAYNHSIAPEPYRALFQ